MYHLFKAAQLRRVENWGMIITLTELERKIYYDFLSNLCLKADMEES